MKPSKVENKALLSHSYRCSSLLPPPGAFQILMDYKSHQPPGQAHHSREKEGGKGKGWWREGKKEDLGSQRRETRLIII